MANNEAGSPAQPEPGSLLPVPRVTSVTSVIKAYGQGRRSAADPATFPTGCLPPDVAAIVEAVSLTARVPESLPASCALAAVGASVDKGLVTLRRPYRALLPQGWAQPLI